MHTRRCVEPELTHAAVHESRSGLNLRKEISKLSRNMNVLAPVRRHLGFAWFINCIYRNHKMKRLDLRAI